MKSMTGFGRGVAENQRYTVEVEIKSVNHRFLDIQLRSPKQVNAYEQEIRKIIKERLPRGRVDVFVTVKEVSDAGKEVAIHWDLVDQLVESLQKEGQARYGVVDLEPKVILEQIVSLPDFVEITEAKDDDESLGELLIAAVTTAAEQNAANRAQEGQALAAVMVENREQIATALARLQSFVALYQGEFKERFEKKLQDYLQETVDQERLLTELAIQLERGDIQEEIDRLAIHLQNFDRLLAKDEPVGRELDFLIQECNREINTIGSKSSAIEIKELVVLMKTTVEKIREQVQNVE
ncbi:YicC family protein [Enterococcus asini]|uniref:YicC/YloC family endoribonuclease n=1 Tax=Enterococcus asini TaxID=57732 RepID=UPI001E35AFCF|nr:YicC/YloC family endoribonuclease [Enterococcus asini]MCD5030097.1 YicC family protein [Enterococcus asini]MDT2745240.1 YicC family protein [Enterococcus asini]MDT2764643.1 YicC family protein [Enterococcus asini]MDT2785256.1 YicC family protein [Enterococcus asini]